MRPRLQGALFVKALEPISFIDDLAHLLRRRDQGRPSIIALYYSSGLERRENMIRASGCSQGMPPRKVFASSPGMKPLKKDSFVSRMLDHAVKFRLNRRYADVPKMAAPLGMY